MNKNELEARKLSESAAKHHSTMAMVAKVATVAGVVYSIQIIMSGFQQIVLAQPDAIHALAAVIEKLPINAMLGWVASGMVSVGYMYERKGKKRAIRTLAKFRRKVEAADPHHSSSDLDENGDTPND